MHFFYKLAFVPEKQFEFYLHLTKVHILKTNGRFQLDTKKFKALHAVVQIENSQTVQPFNQCSQTSGKTCITFKINKCAALNR